MDSMIFQGFSSLSESMPVWAQGAVHTQPQHAHTSLPPKELAVLQHLSLLKNAANPLKYSKLGVCRRGCSGLKEDKENQMQISLQFILMTNTYHNRFVGNTPVTLDLSILPTSPGSAGAAAAPSPAQQCLSSCCISQLCSCCCHSGNCLGKGLGGAPVQPVPPARSPPQRVPRFSEHSQGWWPRAVQCFQPLLWGNSP